MQSHCTVLTWTKPPILLLLLFVLRRGSPLPVEEVAHEFVKTSLEVDESLAIVKYCLAVMLKKFAKPDSTNRIAQKSAAAGTLRDMRCGLGSQEIVLKCPVYSW